jgi:hypothetical protein
MRDLTETERREIDSKLAEVTAAVHALAARVDAVATRTITCTTCWPRFHAPSATASAVPRHDGPAGATTSHGIAHPRTVKREDELNG